MAPWRLIVAVATAVALSGCPSVDEYRHFAEAGTTYATAVHSFADVVAVTEVENTSLTLVDTDRMSPLDAAQHDGLTAASADLLKEIRAFQEHTRTLSRYFAGLHALAATDAPEVVAGQLGSTLTALNRVGNGLIDGTSPLARSLTGIARFALAAVVRRSLRQELEQNGALIDRHLALQEKALAFLAGKYDADRASNTVMITRLRRKEPLLRLQPMSLPEAALFIEAGRAIYWPPPGENAMAMAQKAAAQLRGSFNELRSGTLTVARVQAAVSDADELRALVATLRGN